MHLIMNIKKSIVLLLEFCHLQTLCLYSIVVPKQAAIASKLVDIVAYNITWKTNYRAIFTFKNSQEIVDNKELLLKFIAKWLEHI